MQRRLPFHGHLAQRHRAMHPQEGEVGVAVGCDCHDGEKFRVEILRSKAERRRLIAPNQIHKVIGFHRLNAAEYPVGPMIVGGDRQGPIS